MIQLTQDWACYYSIVRYVPDAFRDEPRNIGVVVLCPGQHFAGGQFQLHRSGVSTASPRYKLLSAVVREYEDQLPGDLGPQHSATWTPERLAELHENHTDMLQFTAPTPIIGDPQRLVEDLFRSRVRVARNPSLEARKRLVRVAAHAFKQAIDQRGVNGTVHLNPGIQSEGVGYKFDLGIQNGHLQYTIDTLSFLGPNVQHSEERAAWYLQMWRPLATGAGLRGIVLYEPPANQGPLQAHFQRVITWVSSVDVEAHNINEVESVAHEVASKLASQVQG